MRRAPSLRLATQVTGNHATACRRGRSDLNRQLVTALTDAGYAVDSASDGEEGHYLGDTEPYDAVILDLGLPKMDGVRCWSGGGATTARCRC